MGNGADVLSFGEGLCALRSPKPVGDMPPGQECFIYEIDHSLPLPMHLIYLLAPIIKISVTSSVTEDDVLLMLQSYVSEKDSEGLLPDFVRGIKQPGLCEHSQKRRLQAIGAL